MICADFLAGANLDNGNPEILPHSIRQFFKFVKFDRSNHACDWIPNCTSSFVEKSCKGMEMSVLREPEEPPSSSQA
jgi:hypothetical protein